MRSSEYTNENPQINLTYAYDFQKERYKKLWNEELPVKLQLEHLVIRNGYALPYRPARGKLWGDGGILNEWKDPIEASWIYHYMTGKYECEWAKSKRLTGTYVYLGAIVNQWGHFLEDCSARLYAHKFFNDAKIFYIGPRGGMGKLHPNIWRFLELLGFEDTNLLFITEPTSIEEIIIPEESFRMRSHISPQFLQIFKDAAANVSPTANEAFDKIFLSRSNWNTNKNKEFGLELIDDVFYKNDFKIIYPENETLDNLVFYLNHALEVGLIFGSAAYSLCFTKCDKIIYLVNKSYLTADGIYQFIKCAARCIYFLDFYGVKFPTSYGRGPFLFLANDLLKKFIRDKNILIDKKYLSCEYLSECITSYNLKFINDPFIIKRQCVMLSKDETKPFYYHPYHAELWARDCAAIELGHLKALPSSGSLSGMAVQMNKLKEIIHNLINFDPKYNFIIYSSHHSQIGWLEETVSGINIGTPGGYKIEAIKMRLRNGKRFSYSVYYPETGWSTPSYDGAMAGSTGKGKHLKGIKIDGNRDSGVDFEYRIYTDKWSHWAAPSEALFAPNGFSSLHIRNKTPENFNDLTIADKSNFQIKEDLKLNSPSSCSASDARKIRESPHKESCLAMEIMAKISADPNILMEIILSSGHFTTDYYLSANPDVSLAKMDPLLHYCTFGWREHRSPVAWLNVGSYIKSHPDVDYTKIDPFLHIIVARTLENMLSSR